MGRKRKYHTEKERREAQRKWQMEHYQRNKSHLQMQKQSELPLKVKNISWVEISNN